MGNRFKIFMIRFIPIILIFIIPIIFNIYYKVWRFTYISYIVLSLCFIWFMMINLFISLLRNKPKRDLNIVKDIKFTVCIPVYNEDLEKLAKTILSVIQANGNKEIIIVDDGSKNLDAYKLIIDLKRNFKEIKIVYRFNKNKGKRKAQEWMFEKSKNEYIVSIDSNAIYEKDSFLNLIYDLEFDTRIGLVTGQVLIQDEYKTMLNRVQSAIWWSSSNSGRKSLSQFGLMGSVTGKLMALRKSVFLKDIKHRFADQQFFGKNIISGDDGFLTTFMIDSGYKVMYNENSIAYCYAQETVLQYLKQQLRWKKNILLRSFWALGNMSIRKNKIYFIYIISNLVFPFILISLISAFLISTIMHIQIYLILIMLFNIMILTFIIDYLMIMDDNRRVLTVFLGSIFNFIMLLPLWIIALFFLDDSKWGTR